MQLDIDLLKQAVSGNAAAFRCITEYQPAGGPGDKVFPPTYEGGQYATEDRVNPETGEVSPCVLLDSVQSQANRMELALLDAHRAGKVELPLIVANFDQESLLKKFSVSSLEAPHRLADALFRDSLLGDVMFRKSDKGRILDYADIRNATGIYGLCPTALVFGLWDSTGPRGGLGAKFQRALVSEMIGMNVVQGSKASSRIDPAQIRLGAGPLYARKLEKDDAPDWTLDSELGGKKLGKDGKGKPSEANHGNVKPSLADGGFTISKAVQTTVLSLAALRRLRFPLNGEASSKPDVDIAARTTLAALGLTAGAMSRTDGDLRSRCHLFAQETPAWELLDEPSQTPIQYELSSATAIELLNDAIQMARDAGLPWEGKIELTPSDELVELVRRSQELATTSAEADK